ncbi:hypothetical protein [Xanthomonas sp. GPE 39]|uniref:hypothetical protein n=1 Tax=Xanthomonas sp. GPE 39 TaxID=1583099 RepID=UPI0005F2D352|nr:hypothetical protein [Xanthomonas sp. GPE 39]
MTELIATDGTQALSVAGRTILLHTVSRLSQKTRHGSITSAHGMAVAHGHARRLDASCGGGNRSIPMAAAPVDQSFASP